MQISVHIFWALGWPMMIMDLVTFKGIVWPLHIPHLGPSVWWCSVLSSRAVAVWSCIIKSAKCTYLSKLSDLNGSFVWVMVMCPGTTFLYNKNYPDCLTAIPTQTSKLRQFPELFTLMEASKAKCKIWSEDDFLIHLVRLGQIKTWNIETKCEEEIIIWYSWEEISTWPVDIFSEIVL